jgi:hypothetical protein
MRVPPSARQYDFVRLFSAFPLPCFPAETAFPKRLRNALMNEKNPMMARG